MLLFQRYKFILLFLFFVSNYCENIFENRKDLQFTVSLFIGVVPPGLEPGTP